MIQEPTNGILDSGWDATVASIDGKGKEVGLISQPLSIEDRNDVLSRLYVEKMEILVCM